MKDERYLVFACYNYYPSGGMEDKRGSFKTIEEAREFEGELSKNYDYTSVYDRVDGYEL